jgi:hypothetical protein
LPDRPATGVFCHASPRARSGASGGSNPVAAIGKQIGSA